MNLSHQDLRPLLDVRHLEVIATVHRAPGLVAAARELHVTPSALSHRIKEAERRLGIPLYTRENRRLHPTPAAVYLASVAERTLSDLARAESDARLMTRSVRHVVRIAVEAYSAYRWLPSFIRFARERADDIELQVSGSGVADPRRAVVEGTLDVAIASGDRPHLSLRQHRLFDDELAFIVPPDHSLAGRSHIEGPDIVDEAFITYTRTPEPDREYALLFRPTDSYPRWTETVELPEAIVEMVAAGLGISVLAGWAVAAAIAEGRVVDARVGAEGISVPWFVATKISDDAEPAETIAALLVEWVADNHGTLAV